jgi:hypothetical protein
MGGLTAHQLLVLLTCIFDADGLAQLTEHTIGAVGSNTALLIYRESL